VKIADKLALLCALFLISCSKPKYRFNDSLRANNREISQGIDENGQVYLRLKPTSESILESPELQERDDEVRRDIEERSNDYLESIETETETRLDFKDVRLAVIDEKLFVNLKVTDNNVETDVLFVEKNKVDRLTHLEYVSGYDDRPLALRAYCLLVNDEGSCENIVVEIAYRLNTTKVVRQFEFLLESEYQILQQREEDEQTSQIQEVEEDELLDGTDSESQEETLETDFTDQEELSNDQDSPSVEQETEEPYGYEHEAYGAEDSRYEDTKVAAEEEVQAAETPINDQTISTLRPRQRPESFEEEASEELSSAQTLRPRLRPSDLVIPQDVDAEVEIDQEALIGETNYILPEEDQSDIIGDTTETHFEDSGETHEDGYDGINTEVTTNETLLREIQTTIFGQSKGSNSDGSIENSTLITENSPHFHPGGSGDRHEQYGSGLSTKLLDYVMERLIKEFPDTNTCVNDLSLREGGNISGHTSHENGLDIDVSYPSSKNNCNNSPRFVTWSWNNQGARADSDFFARNYTFLKIVTKTERVKVIGTDEDFMSALCEWTKNQDFTDEQKQERTKIFDLLRHWGGHDNHYHLRVSCNNQNEGCRDFSSYKGKTTCN